MTGDKQHDATTEFNEALAAGFAAGNFDALGPFYTEDASLLPPRGRLLEGRGAVSAFWLSVSNRFKSVAFATAGVKDLGEAARRETGTYTMTGADGQSVEGKFLFVWQLVGGEWQIESAIWNRNGDSAGRGRPQARQGGGRGAAQGAGGGGQGGGYRRNGAGGGGQGGGYRQGGGNGGYRAGRPSFQAGGGGGAGGRRPNGARRGGGGGQGGAGGQNTYDGGGGLYSNPQD